MSPELRALLQKMDPPPGTWTEAIAYQLRTFEDWDGEIDRAELREYLERREPR